jgi:V/A-type H+-transporting ATPase subunit K
MRKTVITAGMVLVFLLAIGTVYAAEEGAVASTEGMDQRSMGIAFGAALAMGLAALGSGYGIGHAGAAAMGAIAEKPEIATWGLIICALAEGIALYGLVIAFLLQGKL